MQALFLLLVFCFGSRVLKLQRSKQMGSTKYGNIDLCLWKRQENAFHPVLQFNYRNFVIHSKYLKHFSIFKMTCFNKEILTSISNTTSKLCLITPGVCVGMGGGGGGGGGGGEGRGVQRILLWRLFFIHVTVNTSQSRCSGRTEFSLGAYPKSQIFQISPHCYLDLIQFLSQNQMNYSHINEHWT